MRQFVDQHQVGVRCQRAVQVEFLERVAAIRDVFQGQHRQPVEQGGGFAPPMRFDDAGQHPGPLRGMGAGGNEHGVGLAHAGR
jgi:hypothetical protein